MELCHRRHRRRRRRRRRRRMVIGCKQTERNLDEISSSLIQIFSYFYFQFGFSVSTNFSEKFFRNF